MSLFSLNQGRRVNLDVLGMLTITDRYRRGYRRNQEAVSRRHSIGKNISVPGSFRGACIRSYLERLRALN